MTRVLAVTAAHAHILARRRTALLLLALLPLAFYGALYRHSPHAITIGGVASAFSAGGQEVHRCLWRPEIPLSQDRPPPARG
jgi:hypothetical protein